MTILKKILVWILTLESKLILAKYKPYIVAVTGSVGKTSTKDAIYAVLKSPQVCLDGAGICYVRKSEKSLNSEIGLPLTVIGVPNAWRSLGGWMHNITAGLKLIFGRNEYPDCLILEVGADHPGDIRRAASWLRPNIAVITKVSDMPVHVEFFDSPEQVFEEKALLATSVRPGGTVVLFADDAKTLSIRERLKGMNASVVTFGTNEHADIRCTKSVTVLDDKNAPTGVMSFFISFKRDAMTSPVSIAHIIGDTYMYPLLAAAAVGQVRGLSTPDIIKGLESYEPPKGRLNVIAGRNDSTIIDDTYNSSPDATLAALQTLKQLTSPGHKVAILGDMMELGRYSAEEHRTIGREAAGIVQKLVTVGQRSRVTAEEAIKAGLPAVAVFSYDSATEAAEHIPATVQSGDVILVKGSQSVRMERVVKALMKEPEKATNLIVRQEKEWLNKK